MDNNFILSDRLDKIRQIITQYGEDNFYLSFSGGKDSTVLSALIDQALPNNKIPRLYADTGIDYNLIRNFVYEMQKIDDRIVIIKPSVPIKQMLEKDGYPFKSKAHSSFVERYQKIGKSLSVAQYLGERADKKPWSTFKSCPKMLKYQFSEDFNMKISDKCCIRLKEEPIKKWIAENNKKYGIVGIMASEGGRRSGAKCLSFRSKKLKNFQPLAPLTKDWEDWYIESYNIKICNIYKEPYNFERTGCKGCPFAINLQNELDILSKYFPNERKQCETIWEPIYTEYRRLGYRLQKDNGQITFQMEQYND